jgi:non-homologous end joining protein Ku
LIESKSKGKAAPKPEKPQRLAPVIDLMSALKKSLASENKPERGGRARKLRKTA